MSKAIDDVVAERQRQIDFEGWTADHDDEHGNREMAQAASDYVSHYVGRSWLADPDSDLRKAFGGSLDQYRAEEAPEDWPWDERWWKPKDPRRDLVRAAALIIAEIERLDRKAV